MNDRLLTNIRDMIQEDINRRGLRTDPAENLVSVCADDFAAACRSIAAIAEPALAVVTGFFIPTAVPPAGETDGPLGALFLARALFGLGIKVVLVTDDFVQPALKAGLAACGLEKTVSLISLPSFAQAREMTVEDYWAKFAARAGRLTHLIALERVGPSHTAESIAVQLGATEEDLEEFRRIVPAEHHDRCHTMRGRDITGTMSPAHWLFEMAARQNPRIATIGIGDGGNEIGMGKIRWDVVRRNVPRGAVVACRIPVDHLIVCGVSNWGAYGLAAGVRLLRGVPANPSLFDPEREQQLLRALVEHGPLVDGVTGRAAVRVDGLSFDRYVGPLRALGTLMNSRRTEAIP